MQKRTVRSLVILLLALPLSFCSSGGGAAKPSSGFQGHGALSIRVEPNPIIARQVSGNTYDFPFTLVVKEMGGATVRIEQVSVDVTALGRLRIYSQSYDAAEIERRGYPSSLDPGQELRYPITQRKQIPDDRLFSAVSAELTVHGVDAAGAPTTARTTVTVRR
jgi:hypothetical protein